MPSKVMAKYEPTTTQQALQLICDVLLATDQYSQLLVAKKKPPSLLSSHNNQMANNTTSDN